MASNKMRLDISSRSATPKKPCRENGRAFLFLARAELAQTRDRNKKARSVRQSPVGRLFRC